MGFKIKSFRAHGYKGFHAKLDSSEIFIDFTKFTHKIIMIKGPNGYGKSTLINILHQLPDPSSWIMETENGVKQIEYTDTITGAIIYIDIRYPLVNGKRGQTKAYISRIINGEECKLNPNGNVGSFKELIESIFGIDPNFLALSKLTFEDRGIVDKSVSERKRFVDAIIQDTEVYNNMYKVLNKKSTIFKANVNSIISKLNSIGDISELDAAIVSIEQRINKLNIDKDNIVEQIGVNKSKIQLLDPQGSIQSAYEKIYDDLKDINQEISIIENKITKCNTINTNKDDITTIFNELKALKIETETQLRIEKSNIDSILQKIEEENKSLQTKTAKLQALQIENKYDDLKDRMEMSKSNINNYSSILSMVNLPDIYAISKDEFILGINTLYEIKDIITTFRSNTHGDIIVDAIQCIKTNTYFDINTVSSKIDKLKEDLSEYKIEYQRYSSLLEISKKLELRPGECAINSCNFIKDALDAFNQNPTDNINRLSIMISDTEDMIGKLTQDRYKISEMNKVISSLRSIIRSIENNKNIINKLPSNVAIFTDNTSILDAIENGYQFNEIDVLYDYLQYANIIELFKIENDNLKSIEIDMKVYEAKNELIDDIMKDVSTINNTLIHMQTELETHNTNVFKLNTILVDSETKLNIVNNLLELFRSQELLLNNKQEIISRYETIKNNMRDIKLCINNVNTLQSTYDSLISQINPLLNDRDSLKHSRKLSEEYVQELEVYKSKYNTVEVLKKYTSPTKKGIQLLFIKIYMNDIIELANNILSLLFNGEYTIQQFDIDENKFSIPCTGNRIPCDDVSSMSGSQKCMIGLSLSCALLFKAGPNYNILRLDELDSTLDNYNRAHFIITINAIIQIMNIEQVLVISHNQEMDTTDVDIIYIDEIGVGI